MIVETLLDGRVEFLGQEGKLASFLGGSRRFGYYNSESDWDIFVYPEGPKDLEILQSRLTLEGFTLRSTSIDYNIGEATRLWTRENPPKVHVLIFLSNPQGLKSFQELANEHTQLEGFIHDHKILITMAHYMRTGRATGAYIYQCLVELMETVMGMQNKTLALDLGKSFLTPVCKINKEELRCVEACVEREWLI